MSGITLYLRLLGATAVVLAPGWLLARALGVRGVAATLGWSFTLLFGALGVASLAEEALQAVADCATSTEWRLAPFAAQLRRRVARRAALAVHALRRALARNRHDLFSLV